jgi:alanine dehydrogenase
MRKKQDVLSFQLTDEQARSIQSIAGGKGVRISGYVDGNVVKVDNIAINAGVVGLSSAPMADGMAPFVACNGPVDNVPAIGKVNVQKI